MAVQVTGQVPVELLGDLDSSCHHLRSSSLWMAGKAAENDPSSQDLPPTG